MSQTALSQELQAGVDEFLRRGGTITQLNWAGVPIDGTPVEPKPVRAFGREYERVAAEKAARAKAETPPDPVPMPRMRIEPPAAPATKAEICKHFRVPVDAEALADHIADMRPQQDAYVISQLRSIRAEARRLMAHVDTLAAELQRDSDTESGFHSSQTQRIQ